jgi:hypothetical protein
MVNIPPIKMVIWVLVYYCFNHIILIVYDGIYHIKKLKSVKFAQ